MKSETWRRIDDSLADALELPVEEREALLALRLGDDGEAMREALKMVRQAENAEQLFSHSPLAAWSGLSAGSRLGPWELIRPLGTGGMGVVWLALRVDGQATMMAAIKLLPPALSGPLRGDNNLLQRFLMEKEILARLKHPNIARLLEASAGEGDSPNFVMEYVEGAPLMEYLEARGLDRTARLRLFLKICEAVQYAHSNLIIHRDLKPQNILVDRSGEPKLLDFGIGKILNDPTWDVSITLQRAFSLDYASPEQIRGTSIGTAADIYSLGLILFEMMSGERARRWNDKALGEVLAEADRFELPLRAALGPDLAAVLGKATAQEEFRRYRSAGDFADDVERLLDGRPVEARPAGLLYQASCFARRNQRAVLASAFALSMICLFGVWGWLSARQASFDHALAVQRSGQLQIALDAEQVARKAGERQRKSAEEQGKLARLSGVLALNREQQAEARLRDLLRIFDSLISSARWDIAILPGGIWVSIKLMENALRQIEMLEASPATRANLLLLRAEAHSQLAELYGGSNSNVGDRQSSVLHREKTAALWSELHRLDPAKLDWEAALLEARFRVALPQLPKIAGSYEGGWKEFAQSFEELNKRIPDRRIMGRNMGTFYFFRSAAYARHDLRIKPDLEAALKSFEQRENQSLYDGRALRDLALTHKSLANAPGMETEPGLEHANEALRLDRIRSGKNPGDASARLDLAFSVGAVADTQQRAKQEVAAHGAYRESYEIRKGLAVADASNVFVLRSLLYPIREYGVLSVSLQDWNALKVAIREFDWVVERARPRPGPLEFASMNYWRGLVARQGGEQAEACRHFGEAARLLESQEGKAWRHSAADLRVLVEGCQAVQK